MAFDIEDIVDVVITLGDRPISVASFDIPVIVSAHNVWTDRVRIYTDADDLLADGFADGSPVYKMVADIFAGIKAPNQVVIGRRALTDYRATFDVANTTAYTITLSVNTGSASYDKAFTYTSDADATGTEIAAGLAALIEADTDINSFVTATNSTSTLIVAPASTGKVSLGASTSNITLSFTSSETATQALSAIVDVNDQWFFILSDSHDGTDIEDFAEYAAANKKIYFVSSQESAIFTSSTVDIASILNAAQYDNVMLVAYKGADKEFAEGAALGTIATSFPGTGDLFAKTLIGVAVDSISTTEATFAKGKSANIYVRRGGVGWMEDGKVSSGRFFDNIHGSLALEARMQEGVFGLIKRVSDLGKRLAGDEGIREVVSEMNVVLDEFVKYGWLASYKVFPPKASDISTNNKANRFLPDIPFEATINPVWHTFKISGFVKL